MSLILVITTGSKVYTTFYKTIHFRGVYHSEFDKPQMVMMAEAIAFSLATTDTRPDCRLLEDRHDIENDDDVFALLERMHQSTVDKLLEEYKVDPNCRPFDWIAGQDITEKEKQEFIRRATKLNLHKV